MHTTFAGNSMTKTITAIAILQLVQACKVELDAPVTTYLPKSLFPYGDNITPRHLLTFTSGVPEPMPLSWLHFPDDHDTFNHTAALQDVVDNNPHVKREAGKKYVYGNLGYWFLGEIVTHVSGMSFEQYLNDHIFHPLHISSADMHYNLLQTIASQTRAKGYFHRWSPIRFVWWITNKALYGEWCGDWLEVLPHHFNGWAYGGLSGTVYGWRAVIQDLMQPGNTSVLLNETSKQMMFTEQHYKNGQPLEVSLGWSIGERKDGSKTHKYYYRQGGGLGFHSEMRIYPDDNVGCVLLSSAASVMGSVKLLNSLDNIAMQQSVAHTNR